MKEIMKYKCGNKIKIKSTGIAFDKNHNPYRGQETEITEVDYLNGHYHIEADDGWLEWKEWMFEESADDDVPQQAKTPLDKSLEFIKGMSKEEWQKYEEQLKKMPDVVNHPQHYNQGKYEAIDIMMEAVKDLPPKEAVCVSNALKYLLRYHYKNGLQDVKKAQWYIDRLIKEMEENNE